MYIFRDNVVSEVIFNSNVPFKMIFFLENKKTDKILRNFKYLK